MNVYLNDRIVPASDARVSVFDHGFLYGDGVYETMRVYDGVVFMLDEHIERLYRSASLIKLDLPKDAADIRSAVYETLHANRLKMAVIRITVSRGPGELGLDPALCSKPTFVIMAHEFKPYPNTFYLGGIKLIISQTKRNIMEALNPQIKSLNFLNNIMAKIEAKQADAHEAVMLNAEGFITEGTISNIFFIKDGALCTPSIQCGILDGITRGLVIELAAKNGTVVKEGRFTAEELYKAEEVFITNTTMEVMPVSRIDSAHYKIGETAGLLLKSYKKEVQRYVKDKKAESPSIWQ
jgi:branched-chain amino acid aminotransferase